MPQESAEASYGGIKGFFRSFAKIVSKGLLYAGLAGGAAIGLAFLLPVFGVALPFSLPLIPLAAASGSAFFAGAVGKTITQVQTENDYKKIGKIIDETKKDVDSIKSVVNKGIPITPTDHSKLGSQQGRVVSHH